MTRLQLLLSCLLLGPAQGAAQRPKQLVGPDATFTEPFSQVASVRELRDGRVIVLDRRDRLVLLVDFRSGAGTPVGRQGTGPGEYTQPGRLFTFPADTTAIYDGPARRFVLVGPDGKIGDGFRMDAATGAGQRRGGIPKWSDASGRVFTEGSPYAMGEGAMGGADSTAITRFTRGAASGDTIAYVQLDKETIQVRNEPGGGVSVANGVRAFAHRDDWVALPDGGVAIVRAASYRVDWYSPSGGVTVGPVVTTPKVRVTDADKQQSNQERLAAMRNAMPRGRPGSPPASLPDEIRLPELSFPPFKPPFEMGGTYARSSSEVWVLRSRAANDRIAVYDVFTRTGGFTGQVEFPRNRRLIGFGNGTLFTVRADEDDLQYLERWKAPPSIRP